MYILEKPYSEENRINFIVKHNHENGLKIAETPTGIYALEKYEIMGIDENGNYAPIKNPNYEKELELENLQDQAKELEEELDALDLKRIRAVCEPSVKDETTGETWLDYYNAQIQEIRTQIQTIQERITENDITNEDLSALDSGCE